MKGSERPEPTFPEVERRADRVRVAQRIVRACLRQAVIEAGNGDEDDHAAR